MYSVTAPAIAGLGQPLPRLLLPLDDPSGRLDERLCPPLPSVGIPSRGRERCQRLVVPEQLFLFLGGGSSFLDLVHQRIRSRPMDGEHDLVDGGLGIFLLVLHVFVIKAYGHAADKQERHTQLLLHRVTLSCQTGSERLSNNPSPAPSPRRRGEENQGLHPLSVSGRGRGDDGGTPLPPL